MNSTSPHATIRYALLVSLICYLPFCASTPWWLLLFILLAMGYRLISDYYSLMRIPKSINLVLIVGSLVLLKVHYGSIISSNFYIGFLLVFIGLKITEIHNERDLKVLVFCNFYLIFSALIIIQELWIITYLMIAILANLSLMLKLSAPQASLKQIGGTSCKQLLIAIPLSIILFYLFPRIANPLWQVSSQMKKHIGFSEKMNPGSIAELFNDESTALRITFKNKPLLNAYWRGLILNFYNGVSWSAVGYTADTFLPLEQLSANSPADYEILLEPHQQKWLFYTGYPVSSTPKLLFSPSYGLVDQDKIITQRFAYSMQVKAVPYQPLNKDELAQNTQLAKTINPQLNAWAKQQYARLHHNNQAFINFLKNYIKQEPFWYTLSPPALQARNQMDSFWFDTKKGFCEQYASAVTLILRSAGIPARVVIGYQGGQWNPLARYLSVQQNDAHAWLEYWQDGLGWQQLDPTSFIAQERVDQSILTQKNERLNQINYSEEYTLTWLQQSRLLLDSARFFAERWLLFYNQAAQNNLLQSLGLGQWDIAQLIQATVAAVILFIILMGVFYQWWQKRSIDPLLIEYHLLQREFRRFNVVIHPSTTLLQQCQSLMHKTPELFGTITLFLYHYEQLRLQVLNEYSKENKKQTLKLFKVFRRKIKAQKP